MENQNSLPEEKWWGGQILQQINGFWLLPMMIPGIQRTVAEFKPHPNDVILASFPKTGTTWLKSLLYSIINPSSLDSLVNNSPHDLVPFLEVDVYGDSSKSSNIMSDTSCDATRMFNTHIPYQFLGQTFESSGCRVVYVTRNPKDTLNSLWHFVNKWKLDEDSPWELEEAVEQFCRGVIPGAPYYEHVLGYRTASLKNPGKVFFITYEELKNDTNTQVKRLIEFLGCPFLDDKKVEEIVKSCSFENLSSHEVNKSEECRPWFPMPNNSFFRQAKVGDHKKYLSEEAIERIDALTREKFHKSGFIYGI
ncbi:PREDICTED: cytosolic sulfotransferase 15-like [Ipomoea nil]|uniref:cytosolic sulfotransferase 15-like n=1 Tax=Ipomoea nil TaxID=35883 RepID=UPI000901D149|nr:PREDICTED: cytosolic sulfotransferase 15-like [Ipomoea nil]XP_019167721.1 PREDICTED: cytosolic sulfotransferase 15-like [Ipomoea nil]